MPNFFEDVNPAPPCDRVHGSEPHSQNPGLRNEAIKHTYGPREKHHQSPEHSFQHKHHHKHEDHVHHKAVHRPGAASSGTHMEIPPINGYDTCHVKKTEGPHNSNTSEKGPLHSTANEKGPLSSTASEKGPHNSNTNEKGPLLNGVAQSPKYYEKAV